MGADLKVIHLVSACLFLGNVIVSGVWALLAERTRDHAIIQFSNRLVLITDLMFTLVGAIGVVWTGHAMAQNYGGEAGHPWIQWSYALLTFSGLIWLFVLVPIQLKQRSLLKKHKHRLRKILAPFAGMENCRRYCNLAAFADCLLHGHQVGLTVQRS